MPTPNIRAVMRKNGATDSRSGEKSKAAARNAGKNAAPPSIGVGRLCQRSFRGCATQPQRLARRRTSGTNDSVNRKAPTDAKTNTALAQGSCIGKNPRRSVGASLEPGLRPPSAFAGRLDPPGLGRRAEGVNHALNDLPGVVGRAKADQMIDLRDIGHAPVHVLEALFVGFFIGNVADR